MAELLKHANGAKISVAQLVMANEVAVSGKSEAEINAFVDKISSAMVGIVKSGLDAPSATLPGPIKLKTKAGDVYKRAMEDKFERQRGVGVVSAYALAGSEENARGHLVVTAPTGGSAGVMPALVYAVGEGGRKLPQDKIRNGFLAAAAIGYLCKHNATLSGAEGGCQAEIGVASAMGAAFLAQAHDEPNQVIANAAESALAASPRHDVRSSRRLRASAVHRALRVWRRSKAWTGLPDRAQRDPREPPRSISTPPLNAMALTAREMNAKYQGNLRGRSGRGRRALLVGKGELKTTGVVSVATSTAVIAWLITAVYYFHQYTLRSAPSVMMPQLSEAFGMTHGGGSVVARAVLLGLRAVRPGGRSGDGSPGASQDRSDRRRSGRRRRAAVRNRRAGARRRRKVSARRWRRLRVRRRRVHRDDEFSRRRGRRR